MGIIRFLINVFSGNPSPRVRIGLGGQDSQDVKRKWAEIEQLMRLGSPSNFKTAILEGDKLLDHVLKLYGYRGQTMGDRMKNIPRDKYAREFFDDMWQAHILRNRMSHAMDYEVQHFEAKRAIEQFKRVLEELGAL
jgi:hypothetical protein